MERKRKFVNEPDDTPKEISGRIDFARKIRDEYLQRINREYVDRGTNLLGFSFWRGCVALLLIYTAVTDHAYGYYSSVRGLVAFGCVYFILKCYQAKSRLMMWFYAATGVSFWLLHGPGRDAWIAIDLGVAVVIVGSIVFDHLKLHNEKRKRITSFIKEVAEGSAS